MKFNGENIEKHNKEHLLQFAIGIILLLIVSIFSITVGRYPITIKEIGKILLGKEIDHMSYMVFFTLRLPRTIMVVLAGIGLSISGSIYQTIFKNPLATPDIIGVSSGANLGAAIAIVFMAGGTLTIAINAFIGGVVAVSIAIALTKVSKDKGSSSLILSGIIIGSLTQGLIMMLKFFADPERHLAAIEYWSMGSFAGITSEKVFAILPFFLIGIIILVLLRWQINVLSLDEEEVISLGVNLKLTRLGVIIAATMVVASIVSITGLITFIGLIAPHIGRKIRKRNDFNTAIFSGIIGAIILIIADCLARSVGKSEIPISILTTFIGAPFLAYIMIRRD